MADPQVQASWKKLWEKGVTRWHRSVVDPSLQQHLGELTGGEAGVSILVPWCGKSLDLPWLCSQGHNVVGIELSEIGTKQLFEENSIPYSVTREGEFQVYEAKDRKLKLINGDFYKVTPELAGTFEAVWDLNAFTAVEPAYRHKYISVVTSLLSPNAKVLLCTWSYGDQVLDEAPFSLASSLVLELFQERFEVRYLGSRDIHMPLFIEIFGADWSTELLHLLTYQPVKQC